MEDYGHMELLMGHGSDDHKGRNYQDEETYEGHPNISQQLFQEGDVKS